MSNKYYQKHKEKPWKEALERYQNLSEKNNNNNNKKTTTTKGEKSPQKDTKIWVNNEKKTCQYSWM